MDKARETPDQGFAQAGRTNVQGGAGDQGGQSGPTDGAGPAWGDGQAKKDEGVIDAEYVDVEEKK